MARISTAGREFYSWEMRDTSPEMPDFAVIQAAGVIQSKIPGLTRLSRRVGGRWWFRTTDLHDVNVALYP